MPKEEIIPPGEPLEHEYNNADLSPKDFLLAIMRDKMLPLSARMEAASKVAVFEHPKLAQVTQDSNSGLHIIIEGGLPDLPGTNVIMPQHERAAITAKKGNGHDPSSTP